MQCSHAGIEPLIWYVTFHQSDGRVEKGTNSQAKLGAENDGPEGKDYFATMYALPRSMHHLSFDSRQAGVANYLWKTHMGACYQSS